MAIRNDESVSGFGRKLLELMLEKGCNTPKDLAKCLYAEELVTVAYRGTDITKKDDNAIGSIEKKIRKHLHSEEATCLQGEYVNAYCHYFQCSADYLFGYTDIRTPDIDVRQICEKTGLSELVIERLVDSQSNDMTQYNKGWSKLMASPLYTGIIDDWVQAGEQALFAVRKEVERDKLINELQTTTGPDRLDIQCDLEGVDNDCKSAQAAYAGLLFSISSHFAGFIEASLKDTAEEVRKVFAARL